jgi:cation:H+ antiporter
MLLLYILFAILSTRKGPGEPILEDTEAILEDTEAIREGADGKAEGKTMSVWGAIGVFLASCAGLAFGADLLVENAASIATQLGVSQRVISITMVAVGTSVPELATSAIAALKKETDISVGNIIGSNIMNILTVLGITGVIGGIRVDEAIARFDIPWMLGITLLLLFLMLPASRSRITRWEGIFMIAIYLLYIYLIF